MGAFVNYHDLVGDVTEMCRNINEKYQCVVGIPRSGILPASIFALYWNIPLTTPSLFVQGRTLGGGRRIEFAPPGKTTKVLVVDDSMNTGASMKEAQKILSSLRSENKQFEFHYCVIYAAKEKQCEEVHYAGRLISQPRWFEWNWLAHDGLLPISCFDIDGVLCRAPTKKENDYGPNYEKFLKETPPRYIPRLKVKAIITGRLEKYREQTEAWLKKHGVKYDDLFMRPDASVPHWQHKADHYKELDAGLFVEDEPGQAAKIYELTGKHVLLVPQFRLIQGWKK